MNINYDIISPRRLRARRLCGGRFGLSQVVTTLILVVVGVLLSSVITYYATNIVKTRTQQEDVRITKYHVWANSTSKVAALKLQNLGGRDILIDMIAIRDVETEWPNVYYYRVPSGISFTGPMNLTSSSKLIGENVTLHGLLYTRASNEIPLASGDEILLYVKDLKNVSTNDVGTTISMSVSTINGQYIVECNVESASRSLS